MIGYVASDNNDVLSIQYQFLGIFPCESFTAKVTIATGRLIDGLTQIQLSENKLDGIHKKIVQNEHTYYLKSYERLCVASCLFSLLPYLYVVTKFR